MGETAPTTKGEKTMNEYEKNAIEFCEKHGVEIKITYNSTGAYFLGEKEKRDIYDVLIVRGEKQFKFTFGDSIFNTNKRRNAIQNYKRPLTPTKYSILSCLTKNDVGDFDDFISIYDYSFNNERDYINIKQLYFNVKDEYSNVVRLFGDCLDELQEIE